MKKRQLVPPAKRKPRITGGKNGAPFGSRNALKHGKYTHERRALYADIRAYVRRCGELVGELGFGKRRNK